MGPQVADGWLTLPARVWQREDRIRINLNLHGETIAGTHQNQGRAALTYGPFVLAYLLAGDGDLDRRMQCLGELLDVGVPRRFARALPSLVPGKPSPVGDSIVRPCLD